MSDEEELIQQARKSIEETEQLREESDLERHDEPSPKKRDEDEPEGG